MKNINKLILNLLVALFCFVGCSDNAQTPEKDTALNNSSSSSGLSSDSDRSTDESSSSSENTENSGSGESKPSLDDLISSGYMSLEDYKSLFSTTTERADYVEDWVVLDDGFCFPAEFTEDELMLRELLREMTADGDAYLFASMDMYCEPSDDFEEAARHIRFTQLKYAETERAEYYMYPLYYPMAEKCPQTRSEFEERLKRHFSSKIVEMIIGKISTATLAPYGDSTYTATLSKSDCFDDDGYLLGYPAYIEIDGRLYAQEVAKGGTDFLGYIDSAKLLSKTDDEIVFVCVSNTLGGLWYGVHRLVYEDGWKFDWL